MAAVNRRRVRIELHESEPEEQSAAVLAVADYKKDSRRGVAAHGT